MIVSFLFQETNFLKMIQTEMISDTSYMSQPVRLLGLEQLRDLHKAFSQITYVKVRLTLKEPQIHLMLIHSMPILGLTIVAVIGVLMVPITSIFRSVPKNNTPSMTSPCLTCSSVSH